MNKRGELEIGPIILAFVVAIVGLALIGSVASNVSTVANTQAIENVTLTSGAVNASVSLPGQAFQGTPTVTNGTSGETITTAQLTVNNNQVVNGLLTATLTTNDAGANAGYDSVSVNISGTMEPEGYSGSSGARSIALIIIIFFGLGIAVVMLEPTLKSKIFG